MSTIGTPTGAIAEEILVGGEGGQGTRRLRRRRRRPTISSAHLRPAVALISAWISQLARDEPIDTALLATRADLVAFLRGDDDARLANGWRAELLGDGIRSLIAGESGLTFDGQGRLRLIPVAR